MAETAQQKALRWLDSRHPIGIAVVSLIALNVAAVILESVADIYRGYSSWFAWFERVSLAVFGVEYLVRLWAAPSLPAYAKPFGRLRYALSPMAIVDLLAILPSILLLSAIGRGVDLRALRVLRFFRLLRVLKLGRYSQSALLITKVVHDRRGDLAVALGGVVILIVLSSSVIYVAEHEQQPDKFPSIPSSMWWSVITLTTIGYGDVYPVTTMGRIFGAVTAVLGVCIIALPAAIMSAGFLEEMQSRRQKSQFCPHCGMDIHQPPATVSVDVQGGHAHASSKTKR